MKNERGFTLVEMLIALAVFALVMASVYSVINIGLKAREGVNPSRRQNARAALDTLSQGLKMSFLPADAASYQFTGNPSSVSFYALPFGATEAVRFEYYIGSNDKCSGLCRKIFITPLDAEAKQPAEESIAPEAVSLDLEYSNGTQWAQNWNSAENLPEAVRISVGVSTKGKFDRFETQTDLPLARASRLAKNTDDDKVDKTQNQK